MPVRGWTLPGVYSLGGSQIALKAQACAIGGNVVFMGSGPLLTLVAYQYVKAGAKVAAGLDTSPVSAAVKALPALAARPALQAKGVYYTVQLRLQGVTAVLWRDAAGRQHRTKCDAVGIGHGLRSETQLADLASCDFAFDRLARQYLPVTDRDGRTSTAGVYSAGDGARIQGARTLRRPRRLCRSARPWRRRARGRVHQPARCLGADGQVPPGPRSCLSLADPFRRGFADADVVCRCESIIAGSLSPLDGHANPRLAAPAFRRAVGRAAVFVVENAEVLAIEKPGDDFLVETAGGSYRAPVVKSRPASGAARCRRVSTNRFRSWRADSRWR